MIFLFENSQVDVSRCELRREGEVIPVEPQVFDLLVYFIKHRERVVTKDELYESIWKGRFVSETTLTSRINAVRKAVGDTGEQQRIIRTIPRKGFRFVSELHSEYPQSKGSAALVAASADVMPSLPLPDKPSIAVLPFQNISSDPEQEYFADGVVEAITAALSRIKDFFVIARNSAFVFKGRTATVQDIGRELGVAYVLEGSVQRLGSRLRVTVQLVETARGSHLWAEKYDGTIQDLFDFQDQITERIAGALQPSIRIAEIERVRRKRPHELGAYDYTMRAMRHVWLLEEAEATRGLALLDQALAIDNEYSLALALSAWCWAQRSVYNWVDDSAAARAQALRLADKAACYSPDEPLILAVLGTVHTLVRQFGVARVMLERAVALDPNAAWAHSRLGWLDVYSDRPDPARKSFEKALRLSPLDPMNFNHYVGLGSARQVAEDYSEAADLFLRALQERPNALWIHRNLAPALYAAGRLEEAFASRDILLASYPHLTIRQFNEVMVFSQPALDRMSAHLRALGVPE